MTISTDIRTDFVAFLADLTDRPVSEIHDGSDLVEDLRLDSLSMLEVIVFLEDNHDLSIEAELRQATEDPTVQERTVGGILERIAAGPA